MSDNPYLYTTYLAGHIEHQVDSALDWRNKLSEKLASPKLLIYCPMKYEAAKTGKAAGEHVKYVSNLKRGGKWSQFESEMDKIWWGGVKAGVHQYETLMQLHLKAAIEGNRERDLVFWGDFEAVARSTFLIVNYKHNIPTWGTPTECVVAYFLNIPIYIISDVTKTEMNSTLLLFTIKTSGEVFYTADDCSVFVRNKYQL